MIVGSTAASSSSMADSVSVSRRRASSASSRVCFSNIPASRVAIRLSFFQKPALRQARSKVVRISRSIKRSSCPRCSASSAAAASSAPGRTPVCSPIRFWKAESSQVGQQERRLSLADHRDQVEVFPVARIAQRAVTLRIELDADGLGALLGDRCADHLYRGLRDMGGSDQDDLPSVELSGGGYRCCLGFQSMVSSVVGLSQKKTPDLTGASLSSALHACRGFVASRRRPNRWAGL